MQAPGKVESIKDCERVNGCLTRQISSEVDLLALHRLAPARYPHLLESAAVGTGLSAGRNRYDILFAFPQETIAAPGKFLPAFDAAFRAAAFPARDGHETAPSLPFRGGWFVYLGYELAGEIEPSLRLPCSTVGDLNHALPVAAATRMPAAVIRDRLARRIYLVAEEDQAELLDAMADDLISAVRENGRPEVTLDGPLIEEAPEAYLTAVMRVKEYILAGDIFQANLSRAWLGHLAGSPHHSDLYAALRRANPAPFAGLATFGDVAIISSSPERLVRVRGTVIDTRPIAGTRSRGDSRDSDAALAAELLGHPKERAEHIMLVDLERNDLSRVARPGTVVVDEMMAIESYAHVHHIVSNVRARLRPDATPAAIIAALFPGGTITGCPKVRCMEIIAELEGHARGPYTGALGYINHNGDMDLNILIRTLLRRGDRVTFRTGAGIVADSDPRRELAETRVKALGLLRALGQEGGKTP